MTNHKSASRQRLLALMILGVAAIVAVGAFYAARACGCDERQVSLITMGAALLSVLALAAGSI